MQRLQRLAQANAKLSPSTAGLNSSLDPIAEAAAGMSKPGFGPCDILMTVPPEVFAQQREALAWVEQRVREA